MSTLRRVLQAFEDAETTIRLDELRRELAIDPGTLDSMIQHWVRKGRIREVCDTMPDGCYSCGVTSDCPFFVQMPRRYVLVRQDAPDPAPPKCPAAAPGH